MCCNITQETSVITDANSPIEDATQPLDAVTPSASVDTSVNTLMTADSVGRCRAGASVKDEGVTCASGHAENCSAIVNDVPRPSAEQNSTPIADCFVPNYPVPIQLVNSRNVTEADDNSDTSELSGSLSSFTTSNLGGATAASNPTVRLHARQNTTSNSFSEDHTNLSESGSSNSTVTDSLAATFAVRDELDARQSLQSPVDVDPSTSVDVDPSTSVDASFKSNVGSSKIPIVNEARNVTTKSAPILVSTKASPHKENTPLPGRNNTASSPLPGRNNTSSSPRSRKASNSSRGKTSGQKTCCRPGTTGNSELYSLFKLCI